jgi:methylglutaconyl-CoA hydratase
LGLIAAKRAIHDAMECSLEDGLEAEKKHYRTVLYSKDRVEALQAFVEKRKPVFKGE